MTITFDANILRAALESAASKDVRPQLNGVRIEPAQGHHIVAIGTDGWALVAAWCVPETIDDQLSPLTIPHATVKQIPAKAKLVTLTRDNGQHRLLTDTGLRINFDPIDMNYPDWRKVVPALDVNQVPEAPPQFNQSLLARGQLALGRAAGLTPAKARNTCVRTWYGPNAEASVVLTREGVDALVVVMPLVSSRVSHRAPDLPTECNNQTGEVHATANRKD